MIDETTAADCCPVVGDFWQASYGTGQQGSTLSVKQTLSTAQDLHNMDYNLDDFDVTSNISWLDESFPSKSVVSSQDGSNVLAIASLDNDMAERAFSEATPTAPTSVGVFLEQR